MAAGIGAAYMVAGFVLKPTIRFATGWENDELQDVNDRKIKEFIKKHEGKPVHELKEGENHF